MNSPKENNVSDQLDQIYEILLATQNEVSSIKSIQDDVASIKKEMEAFSDRANMMERGVSNINSDISYLKMVTQSNGLLPMQAVREPRGDTLIEPRNRWGRGRLYNK